MSHTDTEDRNWTTVRIAANIQWRSGDQISVSLTVLLKVCYIFLSFCLIFPLCTSFDIGHVLDNGES